VGASEQEKWDRGEGKKSMIVRQVRKDNSLQHFKGTFGAIQDFNTWRQDNEDLEDKKGKQKRKERIEKRANMREEYKRSKEKKDERRSEK